MRIETNNPTFQAVILWFLFSFFWFSQLSSAQSLECQANPSGLSAEVVAEENRIECNIEKPSTFRAYKIDKSNKRIESNRFKVNQLVVLCVTLPPGAYFSIWDAPPNGMPSRLYPNKFSHPPSTKGANVISESQECVGEIGSGYNIRIPKDDGVGQGQFYLLVTDREEKQLSADAFVIEDWQLAMNAKIVAEMKTEIETLKGVADTWLVYYVED